MPADREEAVSFQSFKGPSLYIFTKLSVALTDADTPVKDTAQKFVGYKTKPKEFEQPLECFYWATYGYCTKPDDKCLYSHKHTGVIAAAPVKVGGRSKTVAGRNAAREIEEVYSCEQDIIAHKEQQVIPTVSVDDLKKIFETIKSVQRIASETTLTIVASKSELSTGCGTAAAAIETVLDALVNMETGLEAAQIELEQRFGYVKEE